MKRRGVIQWRLNQAFFAMLHGNAFPPKNPSSLAFWHSKDLKTPWEHSKSGGDVIRDVGTSMTFPIRPSKNFETARVRLADPWPHPCLKYKPYPLILLNRFSLWLFALKSLLTLYRMLFTLELVSYNLVQSWDSPTVQSRASYNPIASLIMGMVEGLFVSLVKGLVTEFSTVWSRVLLFICSNSLVTGFTIHTLDTSLVTGFSTVWSQVLLFVHSNSLVMRFTIHMLDTKGIQQTYNVRQSLFLNFFN